MDKKKKEYEPVPVTAARKIAEQFRKTVVIIAAWDPIHGLLHTTTFGLSQPEKEWAAQGGELVAKALGAALPLSTIYADWRLDRIKALEDALRLVIRAQIAGDQQ